MLRASLPRGVRLIALIALVLLLAATKAGAAGPRWVSGPPYFTAPAGKPVVWYTTQPLYFTDPGDLSASVNHRAADALVAAAAGVWNVPTSAMVLAQGGTLNEHVSAANSYLGSDGPAFPADVQAANSAVIQIAVIYDSDGSVTDMLLGEGASALAECRQNAVTESVDSIVPAGLIQHAILVLNGRCTGPAPEQQLQMRYQLERAFGRVLGIGWSQTNDNVFTGTPQPTNNQALHWPIMHPIDIVCGAYTYQCLPQPFTLRDDDVAAISTLYPSGSFDQPNSSAPGKIWSYAQASRILGTVTFPTGQGMQGVNVLVQREQGGWDIPEAWYDVSSVSGYGFQQNAGNPVLGTGSGLAASLGSTDPSLEGYFEQTWVPDIDPPGAQNGGMFVLLATEAINPLYTGSHAVGPYVSGSVAPSGAPESQRLGRYQMYSGGWEGGYFAPGDAARGCDTGGDGVESAPLPAAAGGWWTGVLCGHGHSAWSSFAVRAGRTATLEVTALDESGFATTAKAMPLIGVWGANDAAGTLPTVAATPAAFNTVSLGTTAVSVAAAQGQGLRFVIADARGDGRPDFAYRARVLYADAIAPAATSLNGGQITITGMGFRAGNEVLVNGVAAVVSSWSATTIVVVAPPANAFAANPAGPVDVEVVDLSTRGATVMSGALTYSASIAPDEMTLVAAPSGTAAVGAAAAFAVRVVQGDGVTPVVGLPVTFSVSAGSGMFGTCATPCVALTDTSGLASVPVTPMAFGTLTLQAAAVGTSQAATFLAVERSVSVLQPVEYVAAGATVAWTPQVSVVENGTPAAGVAVQWSAASGLALSSGSSVASAQGMAAMPALAGPLAAGAQANGQACAWATVCANFAALGVDPAAWRLVVTSGAGQAVSSSNTFTPIVVMVTDGSGYPVAGAPVTIYQAADAAEMPCPARGRCPIAPVLASSSGAAVSDANGLVSVTPMQIPGVGEVTNIAVAAGTQGFVSLSLAQQP
jgi:IPT/TIG domain